MLDAPMSVWLGFDPREAAAFAVTRHSIRRRCNLPIPIYGLVLDTLREQGLYWRPTERRDGRLWDVISDAPMSTEFAISRFLVPHLVRARMGRLGDSPKWAAGWALFLDCDMLALSNIERLFAQADPSKAVMVVKHDHRPSEATKMDGQVQTQYARKNWSSAMLFNVDHPANRKLTVELVNTVPGRDLHRFCWIEDDLIGELDASWNWLVGHSDPEIEPDIAHFTDGIPTMPGYDDCAYAEEWRAELYRWAS